MAVAATAQVLSVRNRIKMIRIHTQAVVAQMVDNQTWRDRLAMVDAPRQSVGAEDSEIAIS
jgi:hypothetical protein